GARHGSGPYFDFW
nr:immunoglobulin heavy chain junction region [Macaca mulatta]